SIELEYVSRHTEMPETELRTKMLSLMADAEDISEDLHRISHQLHPSKIDHLGLVKAAKNFAQEFEKHYELKINFHENGVPKRLPGELSLCAFRIIQECLRNVVKHSGAREAEVFLEKTDHMLRLRVADAGQGFDAVSDQITYGLGFIGMRERLRSVGGKLSIYSEPMRGTRIEALIPLGDETYGDLPAKVIEERIKRFNAISMQRLFSITDTTLEEV
ncbi:MAG TPA: ATP-binding protein, partial [Pyrinomonadaceae bacterium]|nr:ATP-binding protein [Pyrinomonadaceae bacterium]